MQNGYFIAIDLGTTTVAASLLNSPTPSPILTLSALNLQYPDLGTDSIKRIQNGLDEISVKRLQKKAILTINGLINAIKKQTGIDYGEVKAMALAGNTVMEMALCGYPLISLSKPPYKPLSEVFFPADGNALPGFCLKDAELFIFPVLDGFVGGDMVSSIYYLDMINRSKPVFLADFGTNVEIAVGNKDRIFTTSAPAGPAFEGGNISCGMTASKGAISDVRLKDGKFEFQIIENEVPAGICGSGIMSLASALLAEKVIDKNGRILPPGDIESESYSVVHKGDKSNEVFLYFDGKSSIKFSQEDMRQFQFAKSAVKSAAEILMEKYKISPGDDFDVYLSGTFGSRINPDIIDLIDILPFKGKKINFLSDSVLLGCQKYLLSPSSPRNNELAGIIKISKNFPLSGSGLFEKHFIKNTAFD